MIMENYIEILNHFCNDDDTGTRVWMQKPFNSNGKSVATNGMELVLTPIQEGFETIEGKLQNVYPDIRNKDKIILASELKDMISNFPLVDCFDEVENTCDACSGFGQVDFEFDYGGQNYTIDGCCPICDGDGKHLQLSNKPNGRKEPDETKYIQIGISIFNIHRINSLLFVAEKLNSDIKVINQTKNTAPTLFVVGDVELLLMPINDTEKENIINKIEL